MFVVQRAKKVEQFMAGYARHLLTAISTTGEVGNYVGISY